MLQAPSSWQPDMHAQVLSLQQLAMFTCYQFAGRSGQRLPAEIGHVIRLLISIVCADTCSQSQVSELLHSCPDVSCMQSLLVHRKPCDSPSLARKVTSHVHHERQARQPDEQQIAAQ